MVLPYKVEEYVAASFTETPIVRSGFRFLHHGRTREKQQCRAISFCIPLLQFLTAHSYYVLPYNVNLNVIRPPLILLVILLSFGGMIHAQIRPDSLPPKPDTSRPKAPLKTIAFSPENFNFGNKTPHDSLYYRLDSFQIVHPFLISTGNLGAPGHYLVPVYSPAEPFSVRPDAFAWFGFNRYNRRFYNSNQPYTLLQYFVGQPKEQFVNVLHTRNFGDNLNFSFHFIRARSEGFYKRQNTSNTSLQTNLWYKSPGKRYAFMADFFWTGTNVAENGGVANDSTFEFGNQLDRQVNEVNLNSAGTVQRKRDVWMKHTFALGKVIDTIQLDSTKSRSVIMPAWGISVISEVYDEKYNYADEFPETGFYDVIYYDSTITQDSTYCWRVNNSVRLERFNQYGAKKIRGYVGVRHEAGEYFNDTIYHHFQNVYAEGMIAFDSLDSPVMSKLWYVVSGFNKGDYGFVIHSTPSPVPMQWSANAEMYLDKLTPSMIYLQYSGNHLRWQNSFVQCSRIGARIRTTYRPYGAPSSISLWARSEITKNALYFDSTFLPQQYSGSIKTNTVALEGTLKMGWFHSQTRIIYSKTTNDTIIRLPNLVIQETMYADLRLFNNAMSLQVGVDVTWFSEFTAEAYMPNVGQFYLQNSRTVGNYTYISPWVSFRIKPVRVFVKVDHANAGLMGRKYFLLDHYPANDLAVKIGISWLFSD